MLRTHALSTRLVCPRGRTTHTHLVRFLTGLLHDVYASYASPYYVVTMRIKHIEHIRNSVVVSAKTMCALKRARVSATMRADNLERHHNFV